MPHLSPTHHETSKHISPHKTDGRVKPSKFSRFKFKPRQVNNSLQSNQCTDHLVSQIPSPMPISSKGSADEKPFPNFSTSSKSSMASHISFGVERYCSMRCRNHSTFFCILIGTLHCQAELQKSALQTWAQILPWRRYENCSPFPTSTGRSHATSWLKQCKPMRLCVPPQSHRRSTRLRIGSK
jgi:hypothetical protein